MCKVSAFYTVRAIQREVKDRRPHDPVRGDHIWLDWSEEGGGWAQWSTNPNVALHWGSAREAVGAAKWADGHPWWFAPDMRTLKVFRITYHHAWRETEEVLCNYLTN